MYRVIEYFTDLQDGGYAYNVGDEYPREGVAADAERISELSGNKNKRGIPLIQEVAAQSSSSSLDRGEGENLPSQTPTQKKRGRKKAE